MAESAGPQYRSRAVFLGLLIACSLIACSCAKHKKTRIMKRAPFQLSVIPEKLVQRSDSVPVTVNFRNMADKPLIWDSQFSVFLTWHVETDSGQILEPLDLPKLAPPTAASTRQRFNVVAPGETMSTKVDLAKGFRRFTYGHGSMLTESGAVYHFAIGYEDMACFVIPESASTLKIRVEYKYGIGDGGDSWGGFKEWFGEDPSQLGFWQGLTESETVTVLLGSKRLYWIGAALAFLGLVVVAVLVLRTRAGRARNARPK